MGQFQIFEGIGLGKARTPDDLVGFAQRVDRILFEAAPLQSDGVDASNLSREPLDDHVGGAVLGNPGASADEGVATDRDEMVDGHPAADDRAGLNVNVSRQDGGVRENAVVLDDRVVGDVGSGHDVVSVSDSGFAGACRRSLVDRDPFANDVPIPDDRQGILALVLEVLWITADDGVGMEGVFSADGGSAQHGNAVDETASGADPGMRADETEGADFCRGVDFRA